MKNPTCKHCNAEALYCFFGFANTHRRGVQDPLFKFHIGIQCVQCDKWSSWVQQTPELMEYLGRAILIPKTKVDTLQNTFLTPELDGNINQKAQS